MSLSERSLRERAHFNALAETDEHFTPYPEFDYLDHPCIPENEIILKLFPEGFQNKRVLDLGCGVGEAGISFARRGARVTAIDVSEKAIDVGMVLARKSEVEVEFKVVEGNKLPFPDHSFDIVYGNGVLHHLDLKASIPEINRVLKPKGCGFFIEPKKGNPAISVYRVMARNKRSQDEAPLTKRDFIFVKKHFKHVVCVPFQVASLAVFIKLFLLDKTNPNKLSYWRQPILHPKKYRTFYRWGGKCDKFLRKWLPRVFRTLSWNYVVLVSQEFKQIEGLQTK